MGSLRGAMPGHPLAWVGAGGITGNRGRPDAVGHLGTLTAGHFRNLRRQPWPPWISLDAFPVAPHPHPQDPPPLLRTVPLLGAPCPAPSRTLSAPGLPLPSQYVATPGGNPQCWAPCPQPSSLLAVGHEGQVWLICADIGLTPPMGTDASASRPQAGRAAARRPTNGLWEV